jgi:hypothetical protein
MKKVILAVLFLVMVMVTHVQAASPETQKEGNRYQDRVEAAVSQQEVGLAWVEVAVNKKYKKRPSAKKKSGSTSRQNDCEWLYRQPLVECTDIMGEGGCSEGIEGLSVSSQEGIKILSDKAKGFKHDAFNKLCIEVCKTQRMPSRKEFGKMICE